MRVSKLIKHFCRLTGGDYNFILICLTFIFISCSAAGLRIVTPPTAPLDISHLFSTNTLAHRGITIGGRGYSGHEIVAAADGVVILVNSGQLGGYHVRVHHGPAINKGNIYTEYFHVYDPVVKEGDRVKRGLRIGSIEQRGVRRAHGTVHYHYLVVRGTESGSNFFPLNPHDYWVGIDEYKAKREKGLDS